MFLVTRIDDRRLDVRVQGALDGDDIMHLVQAMFDLTADMTHVKVLYRLDDFSLPAPIAVLGDLARQPQLLALFDRIDRCAFVADKPWQRLIDRLHPVLLPNLELKCFAHADTEAAKRWLQGAPIALEGLVIPLPCARTARPLG